MKIVIIGLSNTYESLVSVLEEAGHTVFLITDRSHPVGIEENTESTRNYVQGLISDFNPDLVVNGMHTLMLSDSSDYTYIGNTQESANLETNKWDARIKAGELGWLLPPIVEECTFNTVTVKDRTTFVKPKYGWEGVYKILRNEDPKQHKLFPKTDDEVYVEEAVECEVVACCHFTISNSSYQIIRIDGTNTTGEQKRLDTISDWRLKSSIVPLTSLQHHEFEKHCKKWLDYAVTLGGNYEGNLMGALTKGNQGVYWFEQNSRLCTGPGTYLGTADDWINSLIKTPKYAKKVMWDWFNG